MAVAREDLKLDRWISAEMKRWLWRGLWPGLARELARWLSRRTRWLAMLQYLTLITRAGWTAPILAGPVLMSNAYWNDSIRQIYHILTFEIDWMAGPSGCSFNWIAALSKLVCWCSHPIFLIGWLVHPSWFVGTAIRFLNWMAGPSRLRSARSEPSSGQPSLQPSYKSTGPSSEEHSQLVSNRWYPSSHLLIHQIRYGIVAFTWYHFIFYITCSE